MSPLSPLFHEAGPDGLKLETPDGRHVDELSLAGGVDGVSMSTATPDTRFR